MNARPLINSLEFARDGGLLRGEIAVASLPRLADMLESSEGSLSYVVQGSVDKQGGGWLELEVRGQCRLCCQRCLNGLDYSVELSARLLLCDEAGLDQDEDDEDQFDRILAESHLDVLNLLEDEVLLSLPIAPRHDLGVCQAAVDKGAANKENPFAVLVNLKRN